MTLRDRLTQGSLWILLSQIVVQAMAVLVTVILARYLGATPDESARLLGKYFIFTTVGTVLAQLASVGLQAGLPKLLAEYGAVRRSALGRVASSALGVTLITAAVVGVAYYLLADWIATRVYGDEELRLLLQLSVPAVVFTAVGVALLGVLQGFQRIREYSLVAIAFSALSVPLTWVLVIHYGAFLLPTRLVGAALASVLTVALQTAGVAIMARGAARREAVSLRPALDRKEVRALLGLSTPVFAGSLLLRPALLYQASVIFLVLGDLATGVWKITSAFYRILLFLPLALAVPLLPAVSHLYVTERPWERREKLTQILRMTVVVVLPASLLAGLAGLFLIGTLFGPTYLTIESVQATFILATAAFLDSITLVVVSLFVATGRTRTAFGLDALQAAVIFALTFLLIRSAYGLLGAAGATLLNAGVALVAALVLLGRRGEVDLRHLGELLGFAAFAFGVAGFVLLRFMGTELYPAVAAATFLGLLGAGYRLLGRADREHLRHLLFFLRPRNGSAVLPRDPPEPERR